MVQLFPQVMLHTLPKYPAYIFTCLFPQDRSSKQVKQLSLRPETSTYKGKVGFIQLLCQYLHLSFSHSNESALKIYISTCSTSTQRPSLSNWKEFSSSSFPKQEGFQSGGNAVRLHIRDPSAFAGKVKKINQNKSEGEESNITFCLKVLDYIRTVLLAFVPISFETSHMYEKKRSSEHREISTHQKC